MCVILANEKPLCYKYRTSIFRYVKYAYEPYGTVLPYCYITGQNSIFNVKSDFLGIAQQQRVKICCGRRWALSYKFGQQELDNILEKLSFNVIKILFCNKIRPPRLLRKCNNQTVIPHTVA